MEDHAIIQLYWDRNPDAITATSRKYGSYCAVIAGNILDSQEDVEECVNDTWLGAWNAMPPHRPNALMVFLGKITRNLAFNRCRQNHAQKRSGQLDAVLTELSQCTSADPEQTLNQRELAYALNRFLASLPERKRSLLLCRYWYGDSVEAIAKNFHMTQGAVTMQLKRLRDKLRRYLTERGIGL